MPGFPSLDARADALGGSVFSALADRIARLEGEVYGLHIGDTWLDPPAGASWGSGPHPAGGPAPHRYADPAGLRALRDAVTDKVRARNGLLRPGAGSAGRVLITPGATGALTAAARAILSPGDEVLVLAPYWPLIRGIVTLAGATVVEVPVLHAPHDAAAVAQALQARLSDRTAALYVNTPCNPSGSVLGADVLEALARLARDHGLWLLADEVYEDYTYGGEHLSVGQLLPEQTLTAFSFSKAFGMTGYRVGYLVGPSAPMARAQKESTYGWYSVATPAQYAALQALEGGADWVRRARDAYRRAGEAAAEALGLPAPQGSTFLFLDVAAHLDDRGLVGFLEDCLDDNLILAPGSSFGADFGTWIRLCYTGLPPDVTARGVARLAARLGA